MNLFAESFQWLTDPAHWSGDQGAALRILQHLAVTVLVVLVSAIVALPLGVLVGHTRRGTGLVVTASGAARAIPTLGLLTLLGLWLGIGLSAPVLALVVLAIPSLLAGAYAGVQAVDPIAADSARAIGMTPLQVVWRVELPLAAPVMIGGLRSATLQVVATATLAAYVADVGLGRLVFSGLKSGDYAQMLAGSLLVTLLALSFEIALAAIQRAAARRIERSAPADFPSEPAPAKVNP